MKRRGWFNWTRAAIEGGIRAIELTYTTPQVQKAFEGATRYRCSYFSVLEQCSILKQQGTLFCMVQNLSYILILVNQVPTVCKQVRDSLFTGYYDDLEKW